MDKDTLIAALNSGKSIRAIARQMNTGRSSIRYWMRVFGLVHAPMKDPPEWENILSRAVADSISMAGTLRLLALARVGSSYRKIRKDIAKFNIGTSHWKGMGHGTTKQPRVPWSDILVVDSTYHIGVRRKQALIKDGLLENKCQICGINPSWNGSPLVLRLDHINGSRDDHRIENLRLVCPNCDSQTSTFCGRNKHASLA